MLVFYVNKECKNHIMPKKMDALIPLVAAFAETHKWQYKPARRNALALEAHLKKVSKNVFNSDPIFVQHLSNKLQESLSSSDSFITQMEQHYPSYMDKATEDNNYAERVGINAIAETINPFNISNFTDSDAPLITKLPFLQSRWKNRIVKAVANNIIEDTISSLTKQDKRFNLDSKEKFLFGSDFLSRTTHSYWMEDEKGKTYKRAEYVQPGEGMFEKFRIRRGAPPVSKGNY